MKKELAALALACALIPGVSMAADKLPSSEKLMNDYDKYVVVYTSDDERIYADADTIERDPVSAGELPVIRAPCMRKFTRIPLPGRIMEITAWWTISSGMIRRWEQTSWGRKSSTVS